MHAYEKEVQREGWYDCGSCGYEPHPFPLVIEGLLLDDYSAGTALEDVVTGTKIECHSCSHHTWESDDNLEDFFTIYEGGLFTVWVCGDCDSEYDEEEDAVECCR
jgi:hypothetical protein